MVALIQSKYHAANKGKMAGRFQFGTQSTGIGLKVLWFNSFILFYLVLNDVLMFDFVEADIQQLISISEMFRNLKIARF